MGGKTKRALTGELRRRFLTIAPAFARMVFCASCRDESGRYSEPWLSRNVAAGECDRIIRRCHLDCFKEWMSLTLTERLDDLEAYLVTYPTDVLSNGDETVAACLAFCRALVPTRRQAAGQSFTFRVKSAPCWNCYGSGVTGRRVTGSSKRAARSTGCRPRSASAPVGQSNPFRQSRLAPGERLRATVGIAPAAQPSERSTHIGHE